MMKTAMICSALLLAQIAQAAPPHPRLLFDADDSAANYNGPRVFWHEQLEQAGIDYRDTHCPQAEWRCENSMEFSFNWTVETPAAMDQLGEVIAFCTQPA